MATVYETDGKLLTVLFDKQNEKWGEGNEREEEEEEEEKKVKKKE